MRHRPCRDPSPAPLPDAIKRYMIEKYPHLLHGAVSCWPLGARIDIGRHHTFWPVEVRLVRIVKTDEAYFDTLYNRLTRAIDRKVKELKWTKPARHSKP